MKNTDCLLILIKNQIGSNGHKGWPVAARDRISFPSLREERTTNGNVGLTFLWTQRDAVIPSLKKNNLAIAANFYTPFGLVPMVRNILGNPFIRYIILFGEEYSSKFSETQTQAITSANAIRVFFKNGVNKNRKIDGFENAVYFDKNIPLEKIEMVRQNIQLIDLNTTMKNSNLEEKIKEANKLIQCLKTKEPFLRKPETYDYETTNDSFPYEGGAIVAHGDNIPDAWIKMIFNIYRYGRSNLMNANTDRWIKEINNMVVVIHDPQNMDLSLNPFLIPLTNEKIEAYKKEILSSVLPSGKAYTYGNKLRAYYYSAQEEIKNLITSKEYKDFEFGQGNWLGKNISYHEKYCEINQIQDIIDVLKRDPYSKACVAITWHPAEELMRKHKSSPCLVLIQTLVQDDKLNLTVFFRSHDMCQGWPENAYGCAAIQKEISQSLKIETGILTIISGSAQIYNNYYQQIEEMLQKFYPKTKKCHDRRGNYQIKIENGKIVVILTDPDTGMDLEKYLGETAYELKDEIADSTTLATNHAIYLGTELLKAEIALKNNQIYEQDQ